MTETRTVFLLGNINGTNNLVDVTVDGLVLLRFMFRKCTLSMDLFIWFLVGRIVGMLL
jgi:hypothetical protein